MSTPEEAKAAVEEALSGKATEGTTEEVGGEDSEKEPQKTFEESTEATEDEQAELEQPKTIPLRRFNEVYGRMKELERLVKDMAVSSQTKPPAPIEDELPDFEQMSSKDIAKWNLGQIRKTVQSVVNESIGPVLNNTKEEKARRIIEEAARKYPDFYDYKESIIELAQKHPTLTPEEAYLLASGKSGSAKKAIAKRLQARVNLKKSAKTETRSTPGERTTEKEPQFKSVKEAAIAQAKKLGLL